MPDEQMIPDQRAPNVNVNVGNGRGVPAVQDMSGGLFGTWRTIMNVTAVTFVLGLFTAVTIWNRIDMRQDRADDRQERAEERAQWKLERAEERSLFRDAIREMNLEQNRRTGEVKGAVDVNTAVMRELIQEFKTARSTGTIRHDAPMPKVIGPKP